MRSRVRVQFSKDGVAAIKAIPPVKRGDGMFVLDKATGNLWHFDNDSSASADDDVLVPDVGDGRFLAVETVTGTAALAAAAAAQATADAGVGAVKRTVTVTHEDLTDADGSQAINIGAALPANARILGVAIKLATPFSGGGATSVTVDIGTSADIDALVDGANVFAAAVDGFASSMPLGVAPFKHFASGGQLIATFAADVNVAALDAGSVTIDVTYFVLA